ncbi:MAG: hypothetical protein ACAI38_15475, partial [Myxococcota bacterium]
MKRLPIIAALATLVDHLALGGALGSGALMHAPVALIALTLPSLFLASLGARLVDRYGVQRAMRLVKLLELAGIAICASAAFGFPPGAYLGLVVLGAKGAMFAPIKYSSAPRLAGRGDELLRASMLVATATAVSMIAGIIGGLQLQQAFGYGVLGGLLATLAVVGWLFVPTAQAPAIVEPTVDVMSVRTLGLSLLGIGWFWALAALLVGLLVPYGMVTLGGGSWTS